MYMTQNQAQTSDKSDNAHWNPLRNQQTKSYLQNIAELKTVHTCKTLNCKIMQNIRKKSKITKLKFVKLCLRNM